MLPWSNYLGIKMNTKGVTMCGGDEYLCAQKYTRNAKVRIFVGQTAERSRE